MRVVVCARSERGGEPESGARDQYMPLAGAGSTTGAFFGSGREGKDVCGPLAGREEGVVWRAGAGEEDCD
jgi:hypothetical protein